MKKMYDRVIIKGGIYAPPVVVVIQKGPVGIGLKQTKKTENQK